MIEYTLHPEEYHKGGEMEKWLCDHIMTDDPDIRGWRLRTEREVREIEVWGGTVQMAGKIKEFTFIFDRDEDYTLFALRWL